MKKHLVTSILMTVITTLLLGVLYPLAVTLLAQVCFPDKANGQLIQRNGQTIGSRLIGQPFTGPRYFHSRPSAAGAGYDAANSSASNLGPTNRKLIDRIASDVSRLQGENSSAPVPIDLVTMGELFQNNHHRASGRLNFAWRRFEIDPTYQLLRMLDRLGVIRIEPADGAALAA